MLTIDLGGQVIVKAVLVKTTHIDRYVRKQTLGTKFKLSLNHFQISFYQFMD